MKTYARIVLPAAALLLASCYAELDAPTVSVTQNIAAAVPGRPPSSTSRAPASGASSPPSSRSAR
jgi:hypothetical protein